MSELNLQAELNQTAVTVGAGDLAEAAASHRIGSGWRSGCGAIVCVVEDVERLSLEDQLGAFKQGEGLGHVQVHVRVRRIVQVVA